MNIELSHQHGINKQAKSILSMIGNFASEYELCKRRPPERIHIKTKDHETLQKALESDHKRRKVRFDGGRVDVQRHQD